MPEKDSPEQQPSSSPLGGEVPDLLDPGPEVSAGPSRAVSTASTPGRAVTFRAHPRLFALGAAVVLASTALGGILVGRVSAPASGYAPASAGSSANDASAGEQPARELSSTNGSVSVAVTPGVPGVGAGTAMADRSMMAYPGSLISLVPGPGLGDEASSAAGYRLDGSSVDREVLAASLAEVFRLKGKVVEVEYGWQVGSSDGSGPQVMVSNDAGVTWSFSDPEASPPPCEVVSEPMPYPAPAGQSAPRGAISGKSQPEVTPDLGSSAPGNAGVLPPTISQECPPPGKQLSAEAALAKAKDLVSGLAPAPAMAGVSMEWSSGTSEGGSWANAWQTVEGQQTQLSWSFSFYGDDVTWANGLAAELKKVDAYPIVGPFSAIARLSEAKFSGFGPMPVYQENATPMPVDAGVAVASDAAPIPGAPPASSPGRVQVWWDPVTALKAELSLAQYWQPDGTMLLLPAYHVETTDDRGTWSVIAVDESAIDFLTPPR